jgi:thymidylate kinase
MFNKGLIITLTGVDGVGKSTIVKELHDVLLSKYREEVVLLRHRPGIFPILSVFTKGREQAEYTSSTHKPRQGTNTNTLSSILRFMYYYTDFLLGQVYIQISHVARGKIVLYDRYYFDFVIDMKRSNIQIPTWIPKIMYRFIIKPDINYFLFATPEEIIKRKQELDAKTIEELTVGYKEYFLDMENRYKGLYSTIKNVDKDVTIETILDSYRKIRKKF